MFPFEGETVFTAWEYLMNGKNGFSLARKTVSTGSNEVFL